MSNVNIVISEKLKNEKKIIESLKDDIKIREVSSCENALSYAKKNQGNIFMLDAEAGALVCSREIMSVNPDSFVIIFTEPVDDTSDMKIISVGSMTYLSKPVEELRLKSVIKSYSEMIRKNEGKRTAIAENESYIFTVSGAEDIKKLGKKVSDIQNMYCDSDDTGFSKIFNFIYAFLENIVDAGLKLRTAMHKDKDNFIILFPLSDELLDIIEGSEFYDQVNEYIELSDDYFGINILFSQSLGILEREKEITPEFDETIDDQTKALLRRTHENKISAASFIEGLSIDMLTKISTLEDKNDDLLNSIRLFENTAEMSNIFKVKNSVNEYKDLLTSIREFSGLGFALGKLSDFIDDISGTEIEDGSLAKMFILLYELEGDLRRWHENIFVKKEANDIHYLDSSMLSSCLQIQMLVTPADDEIEEDFELF